MSGRTVIFDINKEQISIFFLAMLHLPLSATVLTDLFIFSKFKSINFPIKETKFSWQSQMSVLDQKARWGHQSSASSSATIHWFCCYGSPSSPSMVRTSTYSSASPTTDAAITADITRWKTSVRDKVRSTLPGDKLKPKHKKQLPASPP